MHVQTVASKRKTKIMVMNSIAENSCGRPLQKLIVALFGGKADKECGATPTSWFSYSISEATEEGYLLT